MTANEGLSEHYVALTRPLGGFAMVANDGRESLRGMLRNAGRPHEDTDLADFKTAVARHLGPGASAMLIEEMYGLDAFSALAEDAPETGRILAVDKFTEPRFGPLADSELDRDAVNGDSFPEGVRALKLFLFWDLDQPCLRQIEDAAEFVDRCKQLGFLSLLEGVVRMPLDPEPFDVALLQAATAFGALKPDVYKTQVPTQGKASPEGIEAVSRELTTAVGAPWVALSNGVKHEAFPDAVTAVCRGGASGFLAGRATWGPATSADLPTSELATSGVARLAELVLRVDRDARPWWIAAGLPSPAGAAEPTR